MLPAELELGGAPVAVSVRGRQHHGQHLRWAEGPEPVVAECGTSLRCQAPRGQHRPDASRSSCLEVDHAVADVDRMRPRQPELPDCRQEGIRRGLWWRHVLVANYDVKICPQAGGLELALDQSPSLAGDDTQWRAGLVQLSNERGYAAKDPCMPEGGINRTVSRDQVFPHVGRNEIPSLAQR